MRYSKFGKSGIEISALGFGCMRFPMRADGSVDQEKVDIMLNRAYELGVNYFDSAPTYCNSCSEAAMGKALKHVRNKVYLSTKVGIGDQTNTADGLRRALETSLEKMDTDYVDFYHFWGINKGTVEWAITPNELMKACEDFKREGLIKNVSFSFHDHADNMKYIIDSCPDFASVLCQYNLLDRSNEEAASYAHQKGLGVIAMGPVGGGRLSAPTNLSEKLTGRKTQATYELALRYVLGNPNFDCALSGMENVEMVEKNVETVSNAPQMTAEEWERAGMVAQELRKFSDLYCTGCNYCQPCPKDIRIPRIFEAFTLSNVYGLNDAAKGSYHWYINGEKGIVPSECIECGQCEQKCPQKIKIIQELKRVEKVLNSL